ncbi:retinal dehydrogenase 2-like [Varroa jacobsoni]|uniref:Aldehyde dehydrogenase domain-containing protein n=1 Tax=Varroa destructor TaxID=109461 RepID=A0A7M7MJY7_VARDE|nr:retinal dehydrogenase 2-like [Varroa destructor]XP_022673198.1 retinal dehydrogenase 2-like [Varroa destructor]XP_022688362.1 retinal dehydrogenase 2-like [Varroa jacobsoni]
MDQLPPPITNPEVKYKQLYINGQFVDAESGKTFATYNPATGEKICDVQEAGKADVDKAVAAARAAFKSNSPWRTMDASARGRLMYKLADLVERDIAYLASIETTDNGKPYQFAVSDVRSGVNLLRYYAGLADKIHGRTVPVDGDHFTYTRYEPVGVCGQILPWNFPLFLTCLKLSPALAAGCVVVIKPAEQTPLSALYLAKLSDEAGFPVGVINVVTGFGDTGAAITSHRDVDKISFTGSSEIGKLVLEAAGKSNCKRTTLEMGGKSPLIVAEDADLDLAANIAHTAIMFNAGQCCVAASRLFVHESVYEQFCKKAVELAKKRTVGCPFKCPDQGPQIDEQQTEKILELIESGIKEGARLLCGGQRAPGGSALFIEPTVFADVTDNMRIAKEEIFGPVQQILKYKTLEEAIERANDTPYGLASGIVSNNINTIQKFAQEIRAGNVWVNTYLANTPQTPFGGFKISGIGREGGIEGVLPYCEIKTVTMKIPGKIS